MPKQIVSEMNWSEAELAQLPVETGMRMRGLETTRLDTLIDAAFAFVLSFLVISQGNLPANLPELLAGIKNIPALAMSFLVLMMFWLEHRRWSRRYGIETKSSVYLSVGLVFVLLIYIIPLRMLFQGMFFFLSGGYLPFNFALETEAGARGFFAFYSVGFLVMALLISALYRVALKRRVNLSLNDYEYRETSVVFTRWLISSLFAVISLIMTYTLPLQQIHWAGFIYFGLFVVQYIQYKLQKKYATSKLLEI